MNKENKKLKKLLKSLPKVKAPPGFVTKLTNSIQKIKEEEKTSTEFIDSEYMPNNKEPKVLYTIRQSSVFDDSHTVDGMLDPPEWDEVQFED